MVPDSSGVYLHLDFEVERASGPMPSTASWLTQLQAATSSLGLTDAGYGIESVWELASQPVTEEECRQALAFAKECLFDTLAGGLGVSADDAGLTELTGCSDCRVSGAIDCLWVSSARRLAKVSVWIQLATKTCYPAGTTLLRWGSPVCRRVPPLPYATVPARGRTPGYLRPEQLIFPVQNTYAECCTTVDDLWRSLVTTDPELTGEETIYTIAMPWDFPLAATRSTLVAICPSLNSNFTFAFGRLRFRIKHCVRWYRYMQHDIMAAPGIQHSAWFDRLYR